jgi:uncharacterized membrane protein
MIWIGGMLFVWLIASACFEATGTDSQAQAVLSHAEGRFRTIRWYSLLTLLGTGLLILFMKAAPPV